jgi:hypothetical protein
MGGGMGSGAQWRQRPRRQLGGHSSAASTATGRKWPSTRCPSFVEGKGFESLLRHREAANDNYQSLKVEVEALKRAIGK